MCMACPAAARSPIGDSSGGPDGAAADAESMREYDQEDAKQEAKWAAEVKMHKAFERRKHARLRTPTAAASVWHREEDEDDGMRHAGRRRLFMDSVDEEEHNEEEGEVERRAHSGRVDCGAGMTPSPAATPAPTRTPTPSVAAARTRPPAAAPLRKQEHTRLAFFVVGETVRSFRSPFKGAAFRSALAAALTVPPSTVAFESVREADVEEEKGARTGREEEEREEQESWGEDGEDSTGKEARIKVVVRVRLPTAQVARRVTELAFSASFLGALLDAARQRGYALPTAALARAHVPRKPPPPPPPRTPPPSRRPARHRPLSVAERNAEIVRTAQADAAANGEDVVTARVRHLEKVVAGDLRGAWDSVLSGGEAVAGGAAAAVRSEWAALEGSPRAKQAQHDGQAAAAPDARDLDAEHEQQWAKENKGYVLGHSDLALAVTARATILTHSMPPSHQPPAPHACLCSAPVAALSLIC